MYIRTTKVRIPGLTNVKDIAFATLEELVNGTATNLAINPSVMEQFITVTGLRTTAGTNCQQLAAIISQYASLDVDGELVFNCPDNQTDITPYLISPVSGATLTSSTITFGWSNGNIPLSGLSISVGKNTETDILPSVNIPTTETHYTLTGLPTDGSNIKVYFKYQTSDGLWTTLTYNYTSCNDSVTPGTSSINNITYNHETANLLIDATNTNSLNDGVLTLTINPNETLEYDNATGLLNLVWV